MLVVVGKTQAIDGIFEMCADFVIFLEYRKIVSLRNVGIEVMFH